MENIDGVINYFEAIKHTCSYEKICELSEDKKLQYQILLENFKAVNSSEASTQEKGKSLEDIATFVLESANVFEVYKNFRTTTNELDQFIRLNNLGKVLAENGLLDKRLRDFSK